MEKWIQMGKEFGFEGKELLAFVKEQQEEEKRKLDDERQERQADRENKRLEAEKKERDKQREVEEKEKELQRQAEERERERQATEREREAERKHELILRQMELQNTNSEHGIQSTAGAVATAKPPKLPKFTDGKDDLDSYLQRFERFARNNKWNETTWSTSLSALLTGRALDVYSRMSETAAVDYAQLKEALLRRYELTENGFRTRFRSAKPEEGESPEQFITRLACYLARWIELSKTDKSFEGICELFVREQFINSCPEDLSVHLRERAPDNLEEIAKIAEQFLIAHGKQMSTLTKSAKWRQFSKRDDTMDQKENKTEPRIQCFNCKAYGHKAIDCGKRPGKQAPKSERRCFLCDRSGHLARDCKLVVNKKAGAAQSKEQSPNENQGLESCIHGDQLLFMNGEKLPIIKSGGVATPGQAECKMPVVKGKIGETVVDTLRDTGCSGVVVRKGLVRSDQYTGKFCYMLLIDNTVRQVPVVKIEVDTPYLKGEVEAQCLPDLIYDLIIGNVSGARAPDDPDPTWQEASAVTTRAQAKKSIDPKPLKILQSPNGSTIGKEDLARLQRQDQTLEKYQHRTDITVKGDQEVSFEEKDGILYRLFRNPTVNNGRVLRQVMVPQPLRQKVMNVAHSSILGGHMGVKKTTDKIVSNFYWPGIHGDVSRFCQSCDICQKTVQKGKVQRVPLEKMPLIDTPFKRVAVDLIGPIYPPSEQGHRYTLTLVDYATRYPDTIPLKSISTKAVAEALVDMYSQLGAPEEILSDMGTQFVSECMQEVSRLLSMKQLTTTPYHPQ